MKKILKWALIIISGFIVLIVALTVFSVKKYGPELEKQNLEKQKILAKKQQLKLDSVINKIKTDKDIRVIKVDYTSDSTLKIYLSPEKSEITAAGFDNLYQIMDIGNISEIEVYKKDVIESSFGYKTQAKLDNFKKEFVSSYDGSCRPVIKYIKEGMNDPNSFEHIRTFVTPMLNGNFEIKTVFRGKNAFGGVVSNSAYSEVTPTGNIVSNKLEE